MLKTSFERAVNQYIAFENNLRRLITALEPEDRGLAGKWKKISLRSSLEEVNYLRNRQRKMSFTSIKFLLLTVPLFYELKDYKSSFDLSEVGTMEEVLSLISNFDKQGRIAEMAAAFKMVVEMEGEG